MYRPGGIHFGPGLRLAWRGLTRTPGTSLGAVLTLGVSFVAVVVLMGVLRGATRPIPVPDGERVMQVELRDARATPAPLPTGSAHWAVGPGIEAAAGLAASGATLVLEGVPAMQAAGAAMEPAAFPLLGVPPALGRWPDASPADAAAIVLGWDLYREFGASPAILGAQVRVAGVPHTVIAVMPEGFAFPERQSYWTVLPPRAPVEQVVARLADGRDLEAARAALNVRVRSLPVAAELTGPYRAQLRPWHTGRGEGGEAAAFAGLAVLVAVLVVICAANVSTLLLVRASERTGALAVHAALGAARAQVAFVLFAEALLVALAGGVVGVAAGAAALHAIERTLASHWGYYWMRMDLQPSVVGGVLVVVLLAACLAGTAPALRASRIDLREVLAHAGRGGSGTRRRWRGRWLVWAQVSLSTIGLVAALLLANAVGELGRYAADLPLDQVVTGTLAPGERYADATARAALLDNVRQQALRIPGASSATLSSAIPGMDHSSTAFAVLGDSIREADDRSASWIAGDEGLLATYGVSLLRGRNIGPQDGPHAPAVALVTSEFAARHLAGREPIGALLRLERVHAEATWAEVVGVVAGWTSKRKGAAGVGVIVPLSQTSLESVRLSVRSNDTDAVLPQLRVAVARADAELALESPQTLRALVAWLIRMPRALAGFGVLGGIAGVLVAAIGLYGVIAFQVRTRRNETGVRRALGAPASHILYDVLREAVIRVAPGVTAGGVIAYGASSALGFLTGGVNLRSPLLYLGAFTLMLGVAVLAALAPAMRAARVDPMVIMRGE